MMAENGIFCESCPAAVVENEKCDSIVTWKKKEAG